MRLTQKNEFFEYVLPCQNIVGDNQATEISLGETEYTCKKYVVGEAIKEFGEMEDVLEEFELTSAKDLRNHLNFQDNMAIWEGELNYKNKIADLEQELAELKQKAIVPKFNVGDYFIEYWDTEPSIYRYKSNNHFECLNKVQGYHCDYIVLGALLLGENFIKKISKEEAEQKLAQLKGKE